jgi:hypothetical protein
MSSRRNDEPERKRARKREDNGPGRAGQPDGYAPRGPEPARVPVSTVPARDGGQPDRAAVNNDSDSDTTRAPFVVTFIGVSFAITSCWSS